MTGRQRRQSRYDCETHRDWWDTDPQSRRRQMRRAKKAHRNRQRNHLRGKEFRWS